MLGETYPPAHQVERKEATTLSRTTSWGDQKYSSVMMPGYSGRTCQLCALLDMILILLCCAGYIPKGQHYFGVRYAETSHQAICSFELEQQRIEASRKELASLQGDPSANPALSLKPIASKAKPYLHTYIPPLHLQTDKAFMSGYTGFVPKSRRYIGEGYPLITMQALKEHASEKRRLISSQNEPVTLTRQLEQTKQPAALHRTHQVGLMPHYTGHVQGERCAQRIHILTDCTAAHR